MNFMKYRKIWYVVSLLLILPGIASLLFQGLNLGIDFKGGTIMELAFDKQVRVEEVRKVLADFKLDQGAQVQSAGDKQVFMRIKPLTEDERDNLTTALKEQIGKVNVVREDKVGPTIGRELTIKALLALAIASVLMVIYITFRFDLKSGIATIVALLHDVIIALGVFSIFQIEIDSAFIAAVLTIVGYSINNTIVVFDRVRENRTKQKKLGSLEDNINLSIWQSLSRSINTTLAVLFVLVSLYFLGGATIKNFVLAIIIGVSVGLYSSLLIATSIWVDMKKEEKVAYHR